jgi:hypothetical protein
MCLWTIFPLALEQKCSFFIKCVFLFCMYCDNHEFVCFLILGKWWGSMITSKILCTPLCYIKEGCLTIWQYFVLLYLVCNIFISDERVWSIILLLCNVLEKFGYQDHANFIKNTWLYFLEFQKDSIFLSYGRL